MEDDDGEDRPTSKPFSFGSSTDSPLSQSMMDMKETKGGFSFSFGGSGTTTAPAFSFGKPSSSMSQDTEVETPKVSRVKQTPATIAVAKPAAGLSFDFFKKKKKDDDEEEDLLDSEPLVLEDEGFSTHISHVKPFFEEPKSSSPAAFKPAAGSSIFTQQPVVTQQPMFPTVPITQTTSLFPPLSTTTKPFFQPSSPQPSTNSLAVNTGSPIKSTQSVMVDDESEEYLGEAAVAVEYSQQPPSKYNNEERWWKIIHESSEMFLYIQECSLEDRLDKVVLGKTIDQFKSILYQGVKEKIESFQDYFDIFSAIEVFYFNRFNSGNMLQRFVRWYLKSTTYYSTKESGDNALYRLLITGESSERVVEAIREKKARELGVIEQTSAKLHDFYEIFFELLSKRPNIVSYKVISATFEEYLEEIMDWKRYALKLKKELKNLTTNQEKEYAFLSTCFDIITGDENTIVDVSNNWIEVVLGLILYKYQRFSDINEIIDLSVHAKELKEESETNVTLEAILLIVIGEDIHTALSNLGERFKTLRDPKDIFGPCWFITHATDFVYHIVDLYKKMFKHDARFILKDLSSLRATYLTKFVKEELMVYYKNIIGENPSESTDSDLWKMAIDYLSHISEDREAEVHSNIKEILLSIPISNEFQIERICRFIKDTSFSRVVNSELHLRLGNKYIESKNYAAGIYHIYRSNDWERLETVIQTICELSHLRVVHYGLEEYGSMIDMQGIQWISSYFKILDDCKKNIGLLCSTLSGVPNDELKIELLCSIDLGLLDYSQIVTVMGILEEIEFRVDDDRKHPLPKDEKQSKKEISRDNLNELRLILAQTLQVKILE